MMHPARRWILISSALLALTACKHSDNSQANAPPATQAPAADTAAAANPNAPLMLRGTIVSVSSTELVLKTDTSTTTVKLEQPFHLYTRAPSDLSHVKESSFIGVTTVKQPDGTEQATEIHVFPEDLRGVGEGSHMMTPDTTSAASRMTNGNVASSHRRA
jgi:hypothetical protein